MAPGGAGGLGNTHFVTSVRRAPAFAQLGEPAEDDVHSLTRRERRAMGYKDLPTSLDQALRVFERSEFMADILGEHVFEFFLRSKWDEWHRYQAQITTSELHNNLDF